ncbi:MAG: phage antirepressor KilAC domain-containing protein [Holosporales bacterium]|jgi:anti-repressor protein|nr:phage antirepressor KilAC domain-containing protein [Holosporales bacterium]
MNSINEIKDLQEFFYDGHEVRTVQINGETWWVLKDVCDALGLSNPTVIAERLDEDEKAKLDLGFHEANIINESGLYRVIMRSDKPSAKPFTRWVTHEVLPQIRKHGAYVTSSKIEDIISDPEAWIKLLTTVKEERSAKARLQIQIEHDKPKIIFADAVSVSESSVLIGKLAKILRGNGIEVGQNRLFERLRQSGFLVKRKGSDFNTPTQKSMELGLFRSTETAITHSDGRITVSKTTKVTGKGQQYFVNMFLNSDDNDYLIDEELAANNNEDNATFIGDDHGL